MAATDTIEKIKNINDGLHFGSIVDYRENALPHVLGPDRPGRLRGMGRGMTFNKETWSQVRDKQTIQMQSKIAELETMVHKLMKNQGKQSWEEASTHQKVKASKTRSMINVIYWIGAGQTKLL